MQPFQFKVPNSNQGWKSRMVDWATKYLAKLEGGSIVYGHEAGPGKTLNQNLRGYLLPTALIPVLTRCGVVMDYGDNVRFSEGEKHRPRQVPDSEHARAQYYRDLYADDIALLKQIKTKLGSQPTLDTEAVWVTFARRIFVEIDRSSVTNVAELPDAYEFEYETLKEELGASYEQSLVDNWPTVMDYLLQHVFIGALQEAVGDQIAKVRSTITNPQELFEKIRTDCQAVHAVRAQSEFAAALRGLGSATPAANSRAQVTGADKDRDRRKQNERKRPQREQHPKSKDADSKQQQTAECFQFKAGKCTRGASCRFSHAVAAQQQSSSQQSAPKKPKTAVAKGNAQTSEIVEGGITYRLAKDGVYYEVSPCAFCWQPESAMGPDKHTSQTCKLLAKCADKAAKDRAFGSRKRSKP